MKKQTLVQASIIIGTAAIVALAMFILRPETHPAQVSGAQADPAMVQPPSDAPAKTTQYWTCGMHPKLILDHPGNCPICHMTLTPIKNAAESTGASQKKVLYWWDPMLGPSSISDHPGKSAMGMDMVPVYAEQMQAGPGVRIDPAVVQNMGVRTATASRGSLEVTIRALGILKPPESGLHDVTLKIGGYVQKLYADTDGMPVSKGQVLFDLYSSDLQVAAQELISAAQEFKALDPKTSDAAKKESQGLVESAKQKLRSWDVADQDIEAIAAMQNPPPTIPFRSPADGHLVEKAVVEGSAVQAGMKLMRIEDHSTLWLDASVYDQQLRMLAIGQEVQASVDAMPGKIFAGKISFIYPHLDHMTRTATARSVLDNPNHDLLPGMYATANIIARPLKDAILIPREAVIDIGTRQIVFVSDPSTPGHFEPRKVQMGLSGDDDKVQILEGLAPGDEVVTSGQFLMDVESRTTEAIQKLRSGDQPATMPAMEGH